MMKNDVKFSGSFSVFRQFCVMKNDRHARNKSVLLNTSLKTCGMWNVTEGLSFSCSQVGNCLD